MDIKEDARAIEQFNIIKKVSSCIRKNKLKCEFPKLISGVNIEVQRNEIKKNSPQFRIYEK